MRYPVCDGADQALEDAVATSSLGDIGAIIKTDNAEAPEVIFLSQTDAEDGHGVHSEPVNTTRRTPLYLIFL